MNRLAAEMRAALYRHVEAVDDAEALLSVPKDKRTARWQIEFDALMAEAEAASYRAVLAQIAGTSPQRAQALAVRALRGETQPRVTRRARP